MDQKKLILGMAEKHSIFRKYLLLFSFIPLILSIGIASALQFSEANAELAQICIDKVWMENTKGKIACVTPSTAEKLVERGWGTLLDEADLKESTEKMMPYTSGMEIDFEKELTLLPISEGGTKALTLTPIIENPTKSYSEFYVAGTETLGDNEMRVTMCGTGMPFPVYAQASPCVLVELGNGEKFIFDIGAGSMTRLNNLEIPPAELFRVFIGHLHVDHVGDLDMLWGQGAFAGRLIPLEVYGPDSINHQLGTQYFVDNMLESYEWDLEARKGGIPTIGMETINVHEFDHTQTQLIYDENNVQITSFPAIHGVAGAVSYRLDWNDLSFVFSSDTKPSKWMIENGQNVDILIHEAFAPAQYLADRVGMDLENAIYVSEKIHTPPKYAGIVYELTNPRLAVMYHSILDEESTPITFEDLRTTYHGPVVLAQDLTVFNITPDGIVTRQAQIKEAVLPIISDEDAEAPLSERSYGDLPKWYDDGALDVESLFEEFKK